MDMLFDEITCRLSQYKGLIRISDTISDEIDFEGNT